MGKYVGMPDGLVRIIGYTSATVVTGEIVLPSDVEDVAPPGYTALAGAWFIESPIWTDARGWPGACCFHDQRLVHGRLPVRSPRHRGRRSRATTRTSRSGPTTTTPGIYELVGAYNVIRALVSQRSLIALTPGGEHVISGGDNSHAPHHAGQRLRPDRYRLRLRLQPGAAPRGQRRASSSSAAARVSGS